MSILKILILKKVFYVIFHGMKHIFSHIRTYIFRGLLAIIPLLLTALAVTLLYKLIDKNVLSFLDQFFNVRHIPGLGILILIIFLYLIGLIFSNVIGRQIFHLVEHISNRIPFIKAVYGVGKQLSESLSVADSDKQAFQKVVLVDCNNSGIWTVAFVTGQIKNAEGEDLIKIFVPTVPNPTTGFIFLAKTSQIVDPGWSVEEGIKMIVSAGIISPTEIKK